MSRSSVNNWPRKKRKPHSRSRERGLFGGKRDGAYDAEMLTTQKQNGTGALAVLGTMISIFEIGAPAV